MPYATVEAADLMDAFEEKESQYATVSVQSFPGVHSPSSLMSRSIA